MRELELVKAEISESSRQVADIFREIADNFNKRADGVERTASAPWLFGESEDSEGSKEDCQRARIVNHEYELLNMRRDEAFMRITRLRREMRMINEFQKV